MRSILSALSISIALFANGQATFLRTLQLPYPVSINGSAVTPDGGLILCGTATVGSGYIGLLVRTDATGNVLWSRTSAGIGTNESGTFGALYDYVNFFDVTSLPDSTLLVTGNAGTTGGVLGPGNLIVQLSATGDTLFAAGGETLHGSHYGSVVADDAGTFLIGGRRGSLNISYASLVRYDPVAHNTTAGAEYCGADYSALTAVAKASNGGAVGAGVNNGFSGSTAFFFRTDPMLNEQWRNHFPLTGWGGAGSAKVAEAADSSIYMVVGAGSTSYEPLLVVRSTSSGATLWSKTITLPANLKVADVKVRDNGMVLIAGSAFGATQMDSAYAWLMQLDANGNLAWAQRYGGMGDTLSIAALEFAPDSNSFFLVGRTGTHGAVVVRVDTLGNAASCIYPALVPVMASTVLTAQPAWFTNSTGAGSGGRFAPYGSTQYPLSNVICAGNTSGYSALGTVYHDADQDGTYDPGENGSPWAMLSVAPNTGLLFGNSSGDYLVAPDAPGTYTITSTAPAPWWALSSDSSSFHPTFTTTDTLFEDLDFGYTAAFDTTVLVGSFSSTPVRCTGQIGQHINLLNQGSTMPQGVLALQLDALLAFSSAVPAPDSIVGNTLYWHFDSLGFYQQWTAQLILDAPGFQYIGDTVHNTLLAYADDGFGNLSLVSTDPWQAIVICAYDPNDKLVTPAGTDPNNATPANTDWLTYTVRFQNTGTDTAYTVVIEDQLSQHLQWNTLQFLGASHDLSGLSIGPLGKASFRFDNILLPDSNANEFASHGFVTYRIAPLPGLAHLTRIENNAGIFFDLNPPVITNTTVNTMVDCASATWTANVFDDGANGLWAYTISMDTMVYTYQWFQNGTPIPGAVAVVYTVPASGDYSVALSDEYGCTVLSPEVNVIVTTVAEANAVRMIAQPNPFSDATMILCNEVLDANTRIDLVDVHGRLVRTLQGNSTREVLLERGDLGSGLYTVRMLDDAGMRAAVRIVVE